MQDNAVSDRFAGGDPLDRDCPVLLDELASGETAPQFELEIVGPTFSGSMQSLALAIVAVAKNKKLAVEVTSPSASVVSNKKVDDWATQLAGGAHSESSVGYRTLAASLEDQLQALCKNIPPIAHSEDGEEKNIVILAEESTFGGGVYDILKDWIHQPKDEGHGNPGEDCRGEDGKIDEDCHCAERIRVTQFPQNISAIRAEHSRLDRKTSEALRDLTQSSNRLLELDLSRMDETADRPLPYNRALSTRSDELMLYGTFDALKVWIKPAAVGIVATDVRDRLFLLNEVRKNLPGALPVLFEMDFLTSHPDYRKISRGAVVIPNGDTLLMLNMDENYCVMPKWEYGVNIAYYSFPSDYSANMFRASLGVLDSFDRIKDETRSGACENPGDGEGAVTDGAVTDPVVTTLAGFQKIPDRGPFCKLLVDFRIVLAAPFENAPCTQPRRGPADVQDPGLFCSLLAELDKKCGIERDPNSQRIMGTGPRSKLLAADSRLSLERPVYMAVLAVGLILLLIARWLLVHDQRDAVMLRPLSKLSARGANAGSDSLGDTGTVPQSGGWARLAPYVLLTNAGILLVVATLQIMSLLYGETRDLDWDLPHGRDEWTLICLFLFYVAFTVIGFWRLYLWRLRHGSYLGTACGKGIHLYDDQAVPHQSFSKLESVLWLFVTLLLLLLVVAGVIQRPTSVDSLTPSMVISFFLLPVGAWFLFEFWRQWNHWGQLAMVLGKTMNWVSTHTTGRDSTSDGGWPSPLLLGERPQSPFNLRFREQDMEALAAAPGRAAWAEATRTLMRGREWPFGEGPSRAFLRWQARLVAEMRYASVAVRTCAWGAILAPTVVMMGMNVYPPPWERFQTIISVALIVASFMAVIYVVLRLERHPLLSRLFTLHGDRLSLGGALSALWPKLFAAVVILVPVLFPDFLNWLYSLLRSINSLQ
jgi:hypothetical protein